MIAALRLESRESISASISCVGVCMYLASFWFLGQWDAPLLFLSVCAIVAIAIGPSNFPRRACMAAFLFVTLFVVLSITSAFVSNRWPANLKGMESLFPALLLYSVIVLQFNSEGHFRAISRALCILSLAVSISVIGALLSGAGGDSRHLAQAASNSILVVPNDIALVAVVSPFCFAEMTRKPSGTWGIIGLLGLLLGLVAIVALKSRTAFVTQLIAFTAMAIAWRGWRSWKAWSAVVALLLVGLTIDSLRGFELLEKFVGPPGTRGSLWLAAIGMFMEAPILGHGPHAFGEMWREYLSKGFFPLKFPVDAEAVPWAHNLYLELLSERGLAGAGAFALLSGRAVAFSWSLSARTQVPFASFARPLFVALLCLLAAGGFELTLHRIWVIIVWFVLLALAEGLRLTTSPATHARG